MIFLSLRMPYVKKKDPFLQGLQTSVYLQFHALPTQHADNKYQRLKNNNIKTAGIK
ncbi:Uncharacterised protein [Phocaeicola vulgatus]|nr:Uncharacterised protein [Phocaeicola vulgatus]